MKSIRQIIKSQLQEFDFPKGHSFLLAVSGGVDSMVLLNLFSELKLKVTIAHVNFSLRGVESDKDEALVSKRAEELKLKCFVKKVDAKKYAKENSLSTQVAAREIRYEWFENLMVQHKIETLVTAHHMDDAVETFFINMNRGTGLKGLRGIPSDREKFRPLLKVSKKEILEYAVKKKIVFREDQSNSATDYERNWFRHNILSTWKKKNPDFLQNMQTTFARLQGAQQLIDKSLEEELKKIKIDLLSNQIRFVTIESLLHPKETLFSVLHPLGFSETQVENILECISKRQVGKSFSSNSKIALVDRNSLILEGRMISQEVTTVAIGANEKEIQFPIHLKFQLLNRTEIENQTNAESEAVDFEKLEFPLELRSWENGDKMRPLGMKGKKKVSDILIDAKVPLLEKQKVMVLTSNKNIIWLVGYRLDDRFKISEKTKKVFLMQWLK